MATRDPKQCIIDYLSQPLEQLQPSPPPPPGAPLTGWRAESRSGGGLGAKAATIQFLQERRLPDRQVHLVAFENETGQQEQWICCIIASDSGDWQFVGGANIPGEETMPRRGYPWVNLARGGRDLLWAGGRVLDQGLGVIRVRLLSANNRLCWEMRYGQVDKERERGENSWSKARKKHLIKTERGSPCRCMPAHSNPSPI